ncbi:MAG TPA: hypothetical protein VMC07_03225 [Candidatus Omnitrophota bacterium]|nr:hypothetical protein [Candidatus Omnitrophota bacterium]
MAKQERHLHRKGIFPVAGIILLIIGIVWFLNDINIFSINLPWVPLVLIVIAIGLIVNRVYRRR